MHAWALLLFCLAADPDWSDLLERALGGDAASKEALCEGGGGAVGALRDALARAPAERRAAIEELLAETQRREALRAIEFRISLPRTPLTLDFVNGPDFRFSISANNKSGKALTILALVRLRVLDAGGHELRPKLRQGRFGFRRAGCLLEQHAFADVDPARAWGWSVSASLARFSYDPSFVTGWEIPGPGVYVLEATYEFDRAAFRERCREPGCAGHDDPAKPWNRALELKHTFRVEMRVN